VFDNQQMFSRVLIAEQSMAVTRRILIYA